MIFNIFGNSSEKEPQTLNVKIIGHDHTDSKLVHHTARVLEIRLDEGFKTYPGAPALQGQPSVAFNKKAGVFTVQNPAFQGDLNQAVFADIFNKDKFSCAQSVSFTNPHTVEIVFPA
ncbi:MAG: hypothetical protein K9G62_05435 [Alphaproteobacteria bacterium]|nr:hypothetical protein [Alphaproteobacteria bacterium]